MVGARVLVLDAQGQNALAVIRTLGRKGLSVTAGGNKRYLPGMLSKYADSSYVHPDPAADQSAFVEDLTQHLEENNYAAVFCVTDLMTAILSKHKEQLEATGTRIGVEDWETYLLPNDKGRLFELVEDIDVPAPETTAPESLDEIATIDADRSHTVVIKPRRTTYIDADGKSHTNRIAGTNYIGPEEDLFERYSEIIDSNVALQEQLPLVQEYIDGLETVCTVGLADGDGLVAVFQHEKYRVYPPSGGVGSVRKGIHEPKMREYADRIVNALGWVGPVHVEFMRTPANEFYLLEVNGRYWGSTALTVNSGVDIPWLHYQQLVDPEASIRRPDGYRTDVKQRKLFYQDILWLRENLSQGNYWAIAPFITSFATTREETLDPSDPLPALGIIPRSIDVVRSMRSGGSVY
ncbi:ATP-grasp domain-containing protein [Halorarius litoreus]|uniref:carboxylate--amine ligase n=1 Tax=Halorarius litoreus TaxID=2962676 RepID=UPI0020CC09A8|nr:ATP-grasp domain-containing protein [Halorarius litoreus]